ncbi:MAG: hypothetical protein ACRCT2_13910 [Plesiomonas shigelloides]
MISASQDKKGINEEVLASMAPVVGAMEIHHPQVYKLVTGFGYRVHGAVAFLKTVLKDEALTPATRQIVELVSTDLAPLGAAMDKLQLAWDANYNHHLEATQEASTLRAIAKDLLRLHVRGKRGEEKALAYQAVYDVVRARVSIRMLTPEEEDLLRHIFTGCEEDGVHVDVMEEKFVEEFPGYRLEKKRKWKDTASVAKASKA